jgi:hypothetical protein
MQPGVREIDLVEVATFEAGVSEDELRVFVEGLIDVVFASGWIGT